MFFGTAGLREAVYAIVECWNHLSGSVPAGSASRGADCTVTSCDSPIVIFVELLANCLPSPAQRVLPRQRVRPRHGADTKLSITFASFGWLGEPLLSR
jgi:hypothetical protein